MTPAPSVDELAARCLSIVSRFHLLARTWSTWGLMVDEIWSVRAEAERLNIPMDTILARLHVELSDQYDRATAARLLREFALLTGSMPEPCPRWLWPISKVPLSRKRLASIRPSAAGIPARPRHPALRLYFPTPERT